jgi:hypothetical protein
MTKGVKKNLKTDDEKSGSTFITEPPHQDDPDFGRTPSLYPQTLLDKRRRQHFITIPQSRLYIFVSIKKMYVSVYYIYKRS